MAAALQHREISALSILMPGLLVAVLGGLSAAQIGLFESSAPSNRMSAPQTVTIASRTFSYRSHGEFFRNGIAVDAPIVTVNGPTLEIMKYGVTVNDYALCVADGGCQPAEPEHRAANGDAPVTGVSIEDARSYASWLSGVTGDFWALPTDAQLAFAAGSRFPDDGLDVSADAKNPAVRWLADYDREAARKASANPVPQRSGHFGENEFGFADFPSNVWEWTTTCNRKVNLDNLADAATGDACGVYLAVGRHRAPMSFFVKNPKGGGCSVGAPPDNLGFRLIRQGGYASFFERVTSSLGLGSHRADDIAGEP